MSPKADKPKPQLLRTTISVPAPLYEICHRLMERGCFAGDFSGYIQHLIRSEGERHGLIPVAEAKT